jgi:hypothetical protein
MKLSKIYSEEGLLEGKTGFRLSLLFDSTRLMHIHIPADDTIANVAYRLEALANELYRISKETTLAMEELK